MKVIISIIKNELLYLEDWINWHLDKGFDKIYLFEDVDSNPHSSDNKNVIIDSVLKYTNGSRDKILKKIVNATIQDHPEFTYVMHIDPDEFLLEDVDTLIANYPNGCRLKWTMFNANGNINMPEGHVWDNFTLTCDLIEKDKELYCYKTLAKLPAVWTDPHTCDKDLPLLEGNLNHYFTKSLEEYCTRLFVRKDIYHRKYRSINDFLTLNPDISRKTVKLYIYDNYPELCRLLFTFYTDWIDIDPTEYLLLLLNALTIKPPRLIYLSKDSEEQYIINQYLEYFLCNLTSSIDKANFILTNDGKEILENIDSLSNCTILCKDISIQELLESKNLDITVFTDFLIIKI